MIGATTVNCCYARGHKVGPRCAAIRHSNSVRQRPAVCSRKRPAAEEARSDTIARAVPASSSWTVGPNLLDLISAEAFRSLDRPQGGYDDVATSAEWSA